MSVDYNDQLTLSDIEDQVEKREDEDSDHPLAIPREELIEELQAGYEALGYPPKVSDMKHFGEYSDSPYKREFGTWTDALEAAGIPVPESRRENE